MLYQELSRGIAQHTDIGQMLLFIWKIIEYMHGESDTFKSRDDFEVKG